MPRPVSARPARVRLADPLATHPMRFPDGTANPAMVHLARVIDHPNFLVGDFTYANDFDPPADWAARLAPYLYAGAPERLVIGRFCQIAHGVRFVTASANHDMTGLSTYPFAVFAPESLAAAMAAPAALPDTVVGNDVWIGHGALILPGVRIGNGAIVGAGAVVARDVPAFHVVAGNPARVIRPRFPPEVIARLEALAWWDWPPGRIEAAGAALMAGDLAACEAAARQAGP
jgi:virginiamycin A acetyltransferase